MKGRCLRRPFGEDYITITPDGLLEYWLFQVNCFEDDARTPTFGTSLDALVKSIRRQRIAFEHAYDHLSIHQRPIGRHDVLRQIDERLSQAERWIEAGFPDSLDHQPANIESGSNHADTSPSSSLSPSTSWLTNKGSSEMTDDGGTASDRPHEDQATSSAIALTKKSYERGVIRALDMRDGRWPTDLEIVAQVGLMEDDSVGPMVHELAKWFYWVELYNLPEVDRRVRTRELLRRFVESKHNGHITRWNNGDHGSVYAQIDACIDSAIRLDRDHRSASLELFCRMPQKRQGGGYVRNIYLELILDGETSSPSPSLPPSTYWLTNKEPIDDPLPPPLEERLYAIARSKKMRRREGEYPFVRFARRMLNELWRGKGRAKIRLATIHAFLGNASTHQQQEYKKLMARAGLIAWGWEDTVRKKRASATYRMTEETRELFEGLHRTMARVV